MAVMVVVFGLMCVYRVWISPKMFIHRKKLLVIETAIDTCTMFDIPFKLHYAIIDFDSLTSNHRMLK